MTATIAGDDFSRNVFSLPSKGSPCVAWSRNPSRFNHPVCAKSTPAQSVSRINDHSRVLSDQTIVEGVMIGDNQDGIVVGNGPSIERN